MGEEGRGCEGAVRGRKREGGKMSVKGRAQRRGAEEAEHLEGKKERREGAELQWSSTFVSFDERLWLLRKVQ